MSTEDEIFVICTDVKLREGERTVETVGGEWEEGGRKPKWCRRAIMHFFLRIMIF